MRSENLEMVALSTLFYYREIADKDLDPIDPKLFQIKANQRIAEAIQENGARFGLVLEAVWDDQVTREKLIKISDVYMGMAVLERQLQSKVIEPLRMYKYGRALEEAAKESIALVRQKQIAKAAHNLKKGIEEADQETSTESWKTAVHGSLDYLSLLEKLLGPEDMKERILTGIDLIDRVLNSSIGGGLHEGQIATIAARPGRGKSTVMAWIVSCILEKSQEEKVGIFSFEMTARDIAKKLIDSEIARRGQSTAIRSGYAGAASCVIADKEQTFARVLIDDRSGLEVAEIIQAADEMEKEGVRLFFMDYIQRVKVGDVAPEALRVAFSEVVEALTLDAKKKKRIWILLSQFSRSAEGRPGTMADLKETSALEENSFFVWGLHRPHTVENGVQKLDAARLEIHILKNRFGEVGGVYPFRVDWPSCTFNSLGTL